MPTLFPDILTKFLIFLINYVKIPLLEKPNLILGKFEGG